MEILKRRCLTVIYELALWLLAFVALPKMFFERLFYKKYQQNFSQRFGKKFPVIKKNGKFLIWIHAVSVGETKAIAALAKKLKEEIDDCMLVISSITETGHAEAKRGLPFADHHVYLPVDLSFIIRPIVRRVQPDLVILAETDFWYNFLDEAKKQGAHLALVNGKVSLRSLARFKKFSFFARMLFSLFDLLCLQSKLYLNRFSQLGIPKEKMIPTGNLKFDDHVALLSPDDLAQWKQDLGISPKDQVIVIGSTHDPEEKLLMKTLESVWARNHRLHVILVPRHPERFQEVASLLEKMQVSFIRFSNIKSRQGNEKVILVDAMGMLRKMYQLADLAIVAGSFTPKVGGHNIIEPLWYHVPVIFGPYMHAQPDLLDLVNEYSAGKQTAIEDIGNLVIELLNDPDKCTEWGKNGNLLIAEIQGATDKTFQALKKMLSLK